MRFSTRTWALLSVMLFIGAFFFWRKGDEISARRQQERSAPTPAAPIVSNPPTSSGPAVGSAVVASIPDPQFPHRLRNTAETVNALAQRDSGLILANALIDTDLALPAIPEQLRLAASTRNFIVQARRAISPEFRAELAAAGAQIVSYVPNNAYLVRLPEGAAEHLSQLPGVKAALPYEPYYKLHPSMAKGLLEDGPQGAELSLRVTAFEGEAQSARATIQGLGGAILGEEPSPFGAQFFVRLPDQQLAALARADEVQLVEWDRERALANDLTRLQIGITTNSASGMPTHLDLTGKDVWVNINDTGVDGTHPGLSGRIFSNTNALVDPLGHGTFVAGIIAGDGANSPSNVGYGSATNANFKGMAPEARVFSLTQIFIPEFNPWRPHITDRYLIETPARTNYLTLGRTNALISNNSWFYVAATDYDSAAARFDSAVRDALLTHPGEQPMFIVFPSGNYGEGGDHGLGGVAGGITSPGTAKNVITVGAIEHLRNVDVAWTNRVVDPETGSTNEEPVFPFIEWTDSSDQVAGFSSRGNVAIGIEGDYGRFKPDVVAPGTFVISARSKGWSHTNDTVNTNLQEALEDANEELAPDYRFATGTSYAAPVVSGLAALIQEFFTRDLKRPLSPALMKALIINGARSVNPLYDVSPRGLINYQGWGLPDITRSLPEMLRSTPEDQWPLRFFDQSHTNALASGESRSWNIQLSTNAQDAPLRVTLVWTDPPGNPSAGIKLVNDLDLVVTTPDGERVFYGNNIQPDSDFTQPLSTNDLPARDFVNNVENVFIPNPSAYGTNLLISVIGRRVNVNAVHNFYEKAPTARRTNDVVQDFALVIAAGSGSITNAFTLTEVQTNAVKDIPELKILTNGMPIMNQTAGANPSLFPLGSSGRRVPSTNQWSFYVFTNVFDTNTMETHSLTNGTNVAFVTFLAENLSRPRNLEADLDVYVSRDARLTNLNPAVLNNNALTKRAVTRAGSEMVVYPGDARLGDIFYVAVKAEDQQAGEFGLMVISTDQPFEDTDEFGNPRVRLFPTGLRIPDGSPSLPRGAIAVGIPLSSGIIARTIAGIELDHQNIGDLFGTLSHGGEFVVLNNHTRVDPDVLGTNVFRAIYDDLDSFLEAYPGSMRSDGPGTLQAFTGQPSMSPWFLFMVDNAAGDVGRLNQAWVALQLVVGFDLADTGPGGIEVTIPPNDGDYFYIDLPSGLVSFTTYAEVISGGPLDLYLRKDFLPTTELYDVKGVNVGTTNVLKHSITNTPPLSSGRYYLLVQNLNPTPTRVRLRVEFEFSPAFNFRGSFRPPASFAIPDDALTNSTITVRRDMAVNAARVGLRVDHPRLSDLVFHLVSPQGTRINLMENRGGNSTNGLGFGAGTNVSYAWFTERTNGATAVKFAPLEQTIFFPPEQLASHSFDAGIPFTYLDGERVDGFLVVSNSVTVAGGSGVHTPPHELVFDATNSMVRLQLPTTPNLQHRLTFVTRRPSGSSGLATGYAVARIVGHETRGIRATDAWLTNTFTFVPNGSSTTLEIWSPVPGIAFDSFELVDTGSNLYLPEESLNLLRHERTLGDWTLEVWDTRAGPGTNTLSTNAVVIDWTLDLDFAFPEMFAAQLFHGSSMAVTIFTNETHHFYLDTCQDTTNVTVTLRGRPGRLRLLADREGLPMDFFETDDFWPIVTQGTGNAGVATFSFNLTNNVAPLRPGKRLYFAVENMNVRQTNNYTIEALINPSCVLPNAPVVLQPDVPVSGNVPEGFLQNNFLFNVVPNATQVDVTLTPLNGDLVLLLSRADPPTFDSFHYVSQGPGAAQEVIVVTKNSAPVPLAPGPWWVGVYNPTAVAVDFNLVIRQTVVTAPPDPGSQIIITSIRVAEPVGGTNQVELFWESVPGRSYVIEAAIGFNADGTPIVPPGWEVVAGPIPAAPTGNVTSTIIPLPDLPRRFFRVRQL